MRSLAELVSRRQVSGPQPPPAHDCARTASSSASRRATVLGQAAFRPANVSRGSDGAGHRLVAGQPGRRWLRSAARVGRRSGRGGRLVRAVGGQAPRWRSLPPRRI